MDCENCAGQGFVDDPDADAEKGDNPFKHCPNCEGKGCLPDPEE